MEKVKHFLHQYRYSLVMILVAIVAGTVDLITKAVTDGKSSEFIDGFISFFSTHNTGAAWSMLNKHTWLLIVLSIVFIGVILFAHIKFKNKNFLYAISMGLVFSGALCNLFDRIAFGYVRDFIRLEFMEFPIFNIADCAITIGVVLLVLFFILLSIKENKEKKQRAANKASTENKTGHIEDNAKNGNE